MAIASMTGFGRRHGQTDAWTWTWEIKTVNAKGLDIRLRAPASFDALDIAARRLITQHLHRGACHVSLNLTRKSVDAEIRVNTIALDQLIAAVSTIPVPDRLRPASLDGLLTVRGIVELQEVEEDEHARAALEADLVSGLGEALKELQVMRRNEGTALCGILKCQAARIAALSKTAEQTPGRTVSAIKERLANQLEFLSLTKGLDADRLHQEAVFLAVKADVKEEIDRLGVHSQAVSVLLEEGGPIGRKLDFLAQELGREANTLCAKSNDAELTRIGVELKAEIEKFREQAQNVE